ncbi:MAG: Ig-like domain-containing protein [Clostridiales bacterium]|nr:Ig-like domain-containing protein [Clostridiales bacterium]
MAQARILPKKLLGAALILAVLLTAFFLLGGATAFAATDSDTVLIDGTPITTANANILRITGDGAGGYTATANGGTASLPFVFTYGGDMVTVTVTGNFAQVRWDGSNRGPLIDLYYAGATDLVFLVNTISASSLVIQPDGNVFLFNKAGGGFFYASVSGGASAEWRNDGLLCISTRDQIHAYAAASGGSAAWSNTGTLEMTSATHEIHAYAFGNNAADWSNDGIISMAAGLYIHTYAYTSSGGAAWRNNGALKMTASTDIDTYAHSANGTAAWQNGGAAELTATFGTINAYARVNGGTGAGTWANTGTVKLQSKSNISAYAFAVSADSAWSNSGTGTAAMTATNGFVNVFATVSGGSGNSAWTNEGTLTVTAGTTIGSAAGAVSGSATWKNVNALKMTAGMGIENYALSSNGAAIWQNGGAAELTATGGGIDAYARVGTGAGAGTWANTGTVNLQSKSDISAYAFARNADSSWSNSGTGTAVMTATDGYVNAYAYAAIGNGNNNWKNDGTLTITAGANIDCGVSQHISAMTGTGSWANTGTLALTADASITCDVYAAGDVDWKNTGEITLKSTASYVRAGIESWRVNASWTNSGAVTMEAATFIECRAYTDNHSAARWTNSGSLNLKAGTLINAQAWGGDGSGDWNNTTTGTVTMIANGGYLETGSFGGMGDGKWTNDGTLTLEASKQVYTSAYAYGSDAVWKNTGTLAILAGEKIESMAWGDLSNNATWINTGTLTAEAGAGIDSYAQAAGGQASWSNEGTAELEAKSVGATAGSISVRALAVGGDADWTNSGQLVLKTSQSMLCGTDLTCFSTAGGNAVWVNEGGIEVEAYQIVAYVIAVSGDSDWINNGQIAMQATYYINCYASTPTGIAALKNTGEIQMTAGTSLSLYAFTAAESCRWENEGEMKLVSPMWIGIYAGTGAWSNEGDLVLNSNGEAQIGGLLGSENRGQIHVQGATQLALPNSAAQLISYGPIYFDKDTKFGYHSSGAFVESTDIPYYAAIINARGFIRDREVYKVILPTLAGTDLARRAVWDLKEYQGITNWLTLGHGRVYKEESVPNTMPPQGKPGTRIEVDGKNYWEVQAGVTSFTKQDIKDAFGSLLADTAVYIPAGNDDLYLPNSGALLCSVYSLRGYGPMGEGDVPPVDPSIVLTKENVGILTLTGDHSWYRGVFNLSEDTVIVDETGALFGGNVNLYEGTILEWHGGVKDEYNKPRINMTEATLDLRLVNRGGANDVFTFCGVIVGDPHSTAIVSEGTVYIKGDCSGFAGDAFVTSGTEFIVRQKTGVYEGKMFGGKIYVADALGEPGQAIIKSNSGLGSVTIAQGTVTIEQDAADADNPVLTDTPIDGLTVGEDAKVILKYVDTKLTDTSVQGELEVAEGERVTFDNLLLDGVLRLTGDDLAGVFFDGMFGIGGSILGKAGKLYALDASATNVTIFAGKTVSLQNVSLTTEYFSFSFTTDPIISGDGACLILTDEEAFLPSMTLVNVPADKAGLSAAGAFIPNAQVTFTGGKFGLKGDFSFSGANTKVMLNGTTADFDGSVDFTGGKLYLMGAGAGGSGSSFVNTTVQGDSAGPLAGDYDAEGKRTPFEADVTGLAFAGPKLIADVGGLRDLTRPKGVVDFFVSWDNGKTWSKIGSAPVDRVTIESLTGTAEIEWALPPLEGYILRAVYVPAKGDNYIAGEEAGIDTWVDVTGVTLNKNALPLEAGASETLIPTVAPADATVKGVTWTSSDETVATVDASGKVTALKAGTATITVKTDEGGFTATCLVTVKVSVTGVTLNKSALPLEAGASETLIPTVAPANATNKGVTWTSSDETVATVDASGKVTALKAGTASITVKTDEGGFTATCLVTVKVSVTGVELDKTELLLKPDETEELTATIRPVNAINQNVTWSSSDEEIVTVDQNGKVTALAAGTATVTVTTADGNLTATCEVVVLSDTKTGEGSGIVFWFMLLGLSTLAFCATLVWRRKNVQCTNYNVQ